MNHAEHTRNRPSSPPYVVPPGEGLILDVTWTAFVRVGDAEP